MTDQVGLLRQSWDEHAQEWINWVRAPGRQDSYWRFHRERFFSLIPSPAPGQLTLDVGSGEGRVGRDLEKDGHHVLGIDCSFTMCQAAAKHPKHASAITADAVKLPLADAIADCAIAFMSLQDIDDMPGAIREIARVLKDGRHLALAIIHPMYSGGGFLESGKGAADDFVISRSYFIPERCISKDSHGNLTVTFYREHRPLQAYTKALNDAGFTIEQLLEVTDKDEKKPSHRVPMFLDILATRRPREKKPDDANEPTSTHSVTAGARPRSTFPRPARKVRQEGHERRHPVLNRLSSVPAVLTGLSAGLIIVAAALFASSHLS
jgi:SAM-dependent methyltransferase